MARIYIGTSGWNYNHWIGTFYPADLKQGNQLQYYHKHFKTVELNNSFYHLPEATSFANWRKQTPANFLFAVKGSRFITHMKKLNVDKATINKFLLRANKLEEKLGPVLFQLPPRWKVNVERLEQFLSRLPRGHRYTFEFRDHTWYTEDVYNTLRHYNCAFCIYELAGHTSPIEVTADFVYVRLHGPGDKYQGSYTSGMLKKWAVRCATWKKDKKDVYIYFDNDQAGYAAFNALQLQKIVKEL